MKNKCSELFEEVFSSRSGGCLRKCVCGKTHFDGYNICDWEEGELAILREKAKQQPEKYIEHDGSIGTMILSNEEIVYDCSCDNAGKAEDFILKNAERIAEYLNKRAKMLREAAKEIEVKNEK